MAHEYSTTILICYICFVRFRKNSICLKAKKTQFFSPETWLKTLKNLIFCTFYATWPIYSYINFAIIDTLCLNWEFLVVLVKFDLPKNQENMNMNKNSSFLKQNSIWKSKTPFESQRLDLKVKKLDLKVRKLDLKIKKLNFSAFWLSAIGWNSAQKKARLGAIHKLGRWGGGG